MKIKKKSITAGQWNYTLKAGKALRKAIEEEDYYEVYTQLRNCWEEIHNQFPEDFDEDELQDMYDDIDNALDNVQNGADYDLDDQDIEDEANYMLDDLYGFCDALRIWVDTAWEED